MNEDYATGASSQPGLKEGIIDHVLFGRNEQGNQHFHLWVEILDAKNDEDLNAIFLNGALTMIVKSANHKRIVNVPKSYLWRRMSDFKNVGSLLPLQ